MKCRINYRADGSVSSVINPQGNRSPLFDNLSQAFGQEKALDIYALTQTDEFLEIQSLKGDYSEPSLEEAVKYSLSSQSVLTPEMNVQIQNSLNSLRLTSYGELINLIENNLMNKGVLVFTEANLVRSGIYSDYEASYIVNNTQIQENIRQSYQALKNAENKTTELSNYLYLVETSNINNLGKREVLNPYIVESEVAREIAGKDLAVRLDDIPYDSIKNKYSQPSYKAELDSVSSRNRNISEMQVQDGTLSEKTKANTREKIQKTFDFDSVLSLNTPIEYLSSVSTDVWNSSPDSIYEILKNLNSRAVKAGLDLQSIEEKAYTKTREEIQGFLDSLYDFMNTPTDSTLSDFSQRYDELFETDVEAAIRTAETRDSQNIYLETDLSELMLFKDFNLIKESENIYKQVEPVQDIEEAYSILFENTNLLPDGVETQEQLRSYINQQVRNYDSNDFNVNLSDLENLMIHKVYFGAPMTSIQKQDQNSRYKASFFNGNYQYLTEDFISDFYKKQIQEKRKNSEEYKNFYSKFDINEKGIVLISNDPMTIAQIQQYMTEDLSLYNMISKNLNIPVYETEIGDNVDEMQFRRESAISNPNMVPKLQGDFVKLSDETIAVRNEIRPIVKTPFGIFEVDYQIGDVSFYNKLPEGNPNFNSFGQFPSKFDSTIDARAYGELQTSPELFNQSKKYYTEKELQEINKKHFDC